MAVLLAAGMALAQAGTPAPAAPDAKPRRIEFKAEFRGPGGGHGDVMFYRHAGLGKWWKDAALVKELGVSDVQVQQMEKIFLDYRLKLVDTKAALEKAEIELDPMMDSDRPDETAVLGQIDRVAAARAELEKTNARMNLAIRRVLTAEQWKKLQTKQSEARGPMMFRRFELPVPPPGAPDAPEIPPLPPDED